MRTRDQAKRPTVDPVFRLVFWTLTVMGLPMLLGGLFMGYRSLDFLITAERAQGQVIEMTYSRRDSEDSGSFTPRVRFQTRDGQEIVFRATVSGGPSTFHRGEAVTVLYKPEDPTAAEIYSFWQLAFVPIFLFGFSGLLLVPSFVFFRRGRRSDRLAARLEREGHRIEARIIDIGRFTPGLFARLTRPMGFSWTIRAQWVDPTSNRVHIFDSDPLPYDPRAHIKGDTIGVLIDPRNPKRHRMDLTGLPPVEGDAREALHEAARRGLSQ